MKRDEDMTKRVAAVVVTHNRRALLQRCVECLLRQSAPELEKLIAQAHELLDAHEAAER